ncbi:DUF4381 domain-containing protein [Allofrancisella guangzhouensis]|uniref:Membrane protein n=1 Tax=Allofrancisella guangzhouensis TaxID=594679 RepID=A0A0A8E3F5_9GAMM|nr:DUF4381 domain-containing protein [Allofrancisella guangzhouensis]AJC48523.1 membrane protein [Allofrancisella guangzhouensis]MBK2027817.1 DUF4381 domain-containing protein [Allofrancisella guangzhouensis]MBK2044807.1 DUF4381 domain-containing protein [Allofrancisella guangzhouensis]MBK2045741.1 DUF4381 domain-containing protein [Allofrancisella guangzhouensis]
MQTNNLLDQLRDIYLPARVSQWWPLAYGWWIVIGIFVVGLVLIAFLFYRKKKRKIYKQSIINDFKATIQKTLENKPQEVLQDISIYLKRVALQKFPNEDIKVLHSKAWIEFLDTKLDNQEFSKSSGRLLTDSYKLQILETAELQEIITVSEKWLRRVL